MDEYEEIGITPDDIMDFSIDLGDILSEENTDTVDNLDSVPVIPIKLTYNNVTYLMYTTESVGIAQLFNKEEILDELAINKTYLLPEGKEIKNKKLLDMFDKLKEDYVNEEVLRQSRVEEFSNRFLRNQLLYVFKKKVL